MQNLTRPNPGLYYDQNGISWRKEPIDKIACIGAPYPKHETNCYCDLCCIDRAEVRAYPCHDRDEIPF